MYECKCVEGGGHVFGVCGVEKLWLWRLVSHVTVAKLCQRKACALCELCGVLLKFWGGCALGTLMPCVGGWLCLGVDA